MKFEKPGKLLTNNTIKSVLEATVFQTLKNKNQGPNFFFSLAVICILVKCTKIVCKSKMSC